MRLEASHPFGKSLSRLPNHQASALALDLDPAANILRCEYQVQPYLRRIMGPWNACLGPGNPGFLHMVVAELTAEPFCQKKCQHRTVNLPLSTLFVFAQRLDLLRQNSYHTSPYPCCNATRFEV